MSRNDEQLNGVTLLGNTGVKYPTEYARNHGDFHEDCINIIMKDLVKLMDPKYIEVVGFFTPRGGISIFPFANYGDDDHQEMVKMRRLAAFEYGIKDMMKR